MDDRRPKSHVRSDRHLQHTINFVDRDMGSHERASPGGAGLIAGKRHAHANSDLLAESASRTVEKGALLVACLEITQASIGFRHRKGDVIEIDRFDTVRRRLYPPHVPCRNIAAE